MVNYVMIIRGVPEKWACSKRAGGGGGGGGGFPGPDFKNFWDGVYSFFFLPPPPDRWEIGI